MNKEQTEREREIGYLRDTIKPGETIYTVLRHVSKSGMYRCVDLYHMVDNEPIRITWGACKATGIRYDRRHEAMGIGGCGMDVGFEAVYNLSITLFCPKVYDHDKAYSLKQQWI
jgi:hypothetical protein